MSVECFSINKKFWISDMAIDIRRKGSDAMHVAVYLMTAPEPPSAEIYKLWPIRIAEHCGFLRPERGGEQSLTPSKGIERAENALRSLVEVGFIQYDAV